MAAETFGSYDYNQATVLTVQVVQSGPEQETVHAGFTM